MPPIVFEREGLFYFSLLFYFIVSPDDSESQSRRGTLRVFNACLILQMEAHEVW